MKTRIFKGLLPVALGATVFLCSCSEFGVDMSDLNDLNFTVFPDGNPTFTDGDSDRDERVEHVLIDIARSDERFVAVGSKARSSKALVLMSEDGIKWTDTLLSNVTGLRRIVWNGNMFVALGYGYGGCIYVSADGVDWQQSSRLPEAYPYSIAWSDDRFVIVGMQNRGQSLVLTSSNGIDWTECHLDPADSVGVIFAVVWADSQFTAFANGNEPYGSVSGRPMMLKSPDGLDWEAHKTDVHIREAVWNGKCYLGSGCLDDSVYGCSTAALFLSRDGIVWKLIESTRFEYAFRSLTWSGTQFVVKGFGRFWDSRNGVSWHTQPRWDAVYSISNVRWCGDRFVAVGIDQILSSPDGRKWTQHDLP